MSTGRMNHDDQRRSLIAFYFGSTAAARDDATDEETIRTVSFRAYRDLNRTLHGVGKISTGARKSMHDGVVDALAGFVGDLPGITTVDDFDKRHQACCSSIIERFADAVSGEWPAGTAMMSYGQAQKWLNMTAKYLAVLDHPDVQDVFDLLHVPLDRRVLDRAREDLKVELPGPERVWSKLGRSSYQDIQSNLRASIADRHSGMSPMQWEAIKWIE